MAQRYIQQMAMKKALKYAPATLAGPLAAIGWFQFSVARATEANCCCMACSLCCGNIWGFERPYPVFPVHTAITNAFPLIVGAISTYLFWDESCQARIAFFHMAVAIMAAIYIICSLSFYRYVSQPWPENLRVVSSKHIALRQAQAFVKDPSVCIAVTNHILLIGLFIASLIVLTEAHAQFCSLLSRVLYWMELAFLLFYAIFYQTALMFHLSLEVYRNELLRERLVYAGQMEADPEDGPISRPPGGSGKPLQHVPPASTGSPLDVYQQGSGSIGGSSIASRGIQIPLLDEVAEAPAAYAAPEPPTQGGSRPSLRERAAKIRERIMKQYNEPVEAEDEEEGAAEEPQSQV